jgi:hypothetical protein
VTKEDMVILGRQSGALLMNPAFQQAVGQFRENLADAFFGSKQDDKEGRERLYQLRLCLDAVVGNLQSFVLQQQQIELEDEPNV